MLICQLTDLHVCAKNQVVNGISQTNLLTERACRVAQSFTPRPDAMLITGDLTENGASVEYEHLADILSATVSIPIYVIPGNHDRRDALRQGLGHLPGVASCANLLHYVIEDHPVRIVMLDTLVPGAGHGALTPEQLHWLDQTLAARTSTPTLVAMHHPPVQTGVPHMDEIGLRDAGDFRAIIARHPQVQRIVCGHQHRPVVAQCAQAVVTIAPSAAHQIALTFDTSDRGAFIFEPAAIQLHAWSDKNGFVSHVVYTDEYPGPFAFFAGSHEMHLNSQQNAVV